MEGRVIFLTGVEPYGKQRMSSTKELALHFNNNTVRRCRIKSIIFPHDTRTIKKKILDIVDEEPDFIVSLGLNELDGKIYIEKKGRNYVNYEEEGIVDNMGFRPVTGYIDKDGPQILENKIDISRIEIDFKNTRVPFKISHDAGTTFNNLILYNTLAMRNHGFIFMTMPPFPETALHKSHPALPRSTQEKVVSLLLKDVALGMEE